MYITQRENGKYLYRQEFINKLTGKRDSVSVTLNSKSRQAQNEAQRILNKKEDEKNNKIIKDSNKTFEEVSSEWLKIKSLEDNMKPATISSYTSRLNTVNEHIGNYLITKLTPDVINRMFKTMLTDDNLAYKTVNERLKLVKKIILFAIHYGYLEKDSITSYLVLPNINKTKLRDQSEKFLEKNDAEYIFDELKKMGYETYSDMLNLQMQTGMRFNEVSALSVEQIDLNNDTIDINRQWDRANKKMTLPKGNYTRQININRSTIRLLKKVFQRRKVLLMAYGVRTDLLFFNEYGMPIDISNVNICLKKIGDDVTTHIFRHTFVTRMVENNVPSKLIAEHIGHKGTDLIDRVYSHFSKKMNEDLKEAINAIQM